MSFSINHRTLIKMEKYIFDCREDLHQSPKYLKRNHKVSNLPALQQPCNNQYLKNKVFLTFDYSYYQTVPKTASLHMVNRIRDLNYLVQHCDPTKDKIEGQDKEASFTMLESSKWKSDKQNKVGTDDGHRRESFKCIKKKIRLPVESMPGVGDYYYQTSSIQKRITYDVKIRGKPLQKTKRIQTKPEGELEKNKCSQTVYIGSHKSNKKINAFPKEHRNHRKRHQSEQQYIKFISSIETANVWERLMEKYKLKGSKFDLNGYAS